MFETLWHRMVILRKQLERSLSSAGRFEEREEIMRKKLKMYLNIYMNLLNTSRETTAPMKFMIFSSTVMLIPKILNTIYLSIAIESVFYSGYLILYEASVEFAATVTPAVLAEMVNREIERMELCVVKQLLVCRGEPARDAVEDAMMYLRQRPFKYTVWRLFSMDTSMIMSVVGLLTTYTVAMVQFAHFYD